MFLLMPSAYWYTTIGVYFNRAAGAAGAIPPAYIPAAVVDNAAAAARPRPSSTWRVTCAVHG